MDVFQRIKENRSKMSNSFGKVADFIINNHEDIPFMKVKEIAEKSGVNDSVVVRFAGSLGYSGFVEMRKSIEKHIKKKFNLPNRMIANEINNNSSCTEIMSIVFNQDSANLMSTLRNPYNNKFDEIVQTIKKSKKVYLVGNRGLHNIANLMEFLLTLTGIESISLNPADSTDYQKLIKMDNESLLIAYSFPRYSRGIHEAIRISKMKSAKSIVFTDSIYSPDAKIADYTMVMDVESRTFINSYVSIISTMNAIITSIGNKYKDETIDSLNDIEDCLQEFEAIEDYVSELI